MFTRLLSLLTANNKTWLYQILAGAGLGLATTTAFNTFLGYYKDRAIAELGQLGSISGLLGLGGFDKAISIIIGAYLASVYIKTFATGLKVVKK